METSGTPIRSVHEAASPSTGGELLLQLLQQRRPSSTLPASCGRADHSSLCGGSAFHNRDHSNGSSVPEWGDSSSFSRASSSDACACEEDEQEREAPFRSRISPAEASAPPNEEQARFQLQHDPAVAAMGPSHLVGEAGAIASSFGSASGDGRRGTSPFLHQELYQSYRRQHQHLGLQQVLPHAPFDVPFPQPPPSEHLLDPLLSSMHNQLLSPYPYPRLPLPDSNLYERFPPPPFSHTGLLTSSRLQDSTAGLPYAASGQHTSFCNDRLTNVQKMASLRVLVNSSAQSLSLPVSENGFSPPGSQLYTQFGSIPVEMPQAQSVLEPAHQDPKGSVAKFSDHSEGDWQHKSLIPEANISNPSTHALQNRILKHADSKVSSEMYGDGVEKSLEGRPFFVNDVVMTRAPGRQKLRNRTNKNSTSEDIRNVSDAEMKLDHGCGTTRARLSKTQKGADAAHKGRTGLSHWVPVMKEKREEPLCKTMDSKACSEKATNKEIDERTRHRDLHEEWKLEKPNLPSGLLKPEPMDSPISQPSRDKVSLQQDPLGLPSGSRVESAPSSATEQSKQALQVSPGPDSLDSRIAEGVVASLKPPVDFSIERDEDNAETLTRSLSQLEYGTEDEVDEGKASRVKHLTSQALNLDGKEPDGNVALPLTRYSRREAFHRLDAKKCTSNLLAIFQGLIPSDDEKQRRNRLLTCLDELVTGIWCDARLYLFGSCANGFGVCNSDIDVCLSIKGESATRSEVVCILADALKANDMLNVQALTHARVPIVKYSDPKTGISCDVCVNNMLAVVNTKLLHDYAQIDVRLRQLAFMVKHWAKCRQVNETYRGTLSSYAYVLMCVHFLQQRKPPVLPCLQEMEPTYRVTVGNIECSYYDLVDNLKSFGQKNKETLAELVTLFFDYWAFRHDYTRTVVSIRTGSFLTKGEKDWTRRIGNERHLICIEDPFEISHDLGRVVDKHSIRVLRDEFQRAARIMRQDVNPCVTLFEPYIRQKA